MSIVQVQKQVERIINLLAKINLEYRKSNTISHTRSIQDSNLRIVFYESGGIDLNSIVYLFVRREIFNTFAGIDMAIYRDVIECKFISSSYLDSSPTSYNSYPSTEEDLESRLFQLSTTGADEKLLYNYELGWYLKDIFKNLDSTYNIIELYMPKNNSKFHDNIINELELCLDKIVNGSL